MTKLTRATVSTTVHVTIDDNTSTNPIASRGCDEVIDAPPRAKPLLGNCECPYVIFKIDWNTKVSGERSSKRS